MKGNNFFQQAIKGVAIKPVSIASGAAAAVAIPVSTLQKGRQLVFSLIAGVFAAGATATCVVQGQKRSDDAWEALKNSVGTDIALTPSELSQGAALETSGQFTLTVPVSEIDLAKYKAVRLLFTAGTANAMLIGADFTIFDLYDMPSATVDKTFALARVPVA